MSEDKRDINLDELENVNGGGFVPFNFFGPDGTTDDNVTTHTCPDCGAKFFSEDALVWHEQTSHGNTVVTQDSSSSQARPTITI